LIPNPKVNYTSANSTGSLTFTPVANKTGTATVTVTVKDGGTSNNIVTRTFTVTVNAVNQAPTLNAISNLTFNKKPVCKLSVYPASLPARPAKIRHSPSRRVPAISVDSQSEGQLHQRK